MSGTTVETISRWFDNAKEQGGTHLLVICDTFDWDDYPIVVMSDEECVAQFKDPGSMQKVMEVYDLRKDKEEQLALLRCFSLPEGV